VPHGKAMVETGLATRPSGGDGGLHLGKQGKWGRIVEALHLKLRALADVVDAVRSVAEGSQRPLLNVRPESFQVRMGEPGTGLPYLWTARVALADPGDAVALPIKASDTRFYVSASAASVSVYTPTTAARGTSGVGTLRIREVLAAGGGAGEQTIVEGTLASN